MSVATRAPAFRPTAPAATGRRRRRQKRACEWSERSDAYRAGGLFPAADAKGRPKPPCDRLARASRAAREPGLHCHRQAVFARQKAFQAPACLRRSPTRHRCHSEGVLNSFRATHRHLHLRRMVSSHSAPEGHCVCQRTTAKKEATSAAAWPAAQCDSSPNCVPTATVSDEVSNSLHSAPAPAPADLASEHAKVSLRCSVVRNAAPSWQLPPVPGPRCSRHKPRLRRAQAVGR